MFNMELCIDHLMCIATASNMLDAGKAAVLR